MNEDRQELYKSILNNELSFKYFDNFDRPREIGISEEIKDLLNRLLAKKVEDRINPEKIQKHPFFQDINFQDVLQNKIKAPFIPTIVFFKIK
jgi:serine/threonine protein kinase